MKRPVLALLGLAICTAAVVGWTWGLYEVTRIGTCASGGPYVSARECPAGTGLRIMTLMGSVFGGLIGTAVYSAGRAQHGRAAAGLGVLMWFFLFVGGAGAMALSAYGPAAPDSSGRTVAIFLGLLFVPMGVGPLIAALGFGAGRRRLRERMAEGVTRPNAPGGPARPVTGSGVRMAGGDPLDRLAQLEDLRAKGIVDQPEFERLKAEILRDQ